MVRFDFACKKCEKTFVVWSDEAKVCAYCGSKRVFKVFLTAPAASTGNANRVDKLAEQQLTAAGLSNYTNAGGTIRRTRRTDPKQLEAIAAAKANNVPFDLKGPIVTSAMGRGPVPIPHIQQAVQSFNQGKSKITHNPRGQGGLVKNVLQRGRQLSPIGQPSIYRLPKQGTPKDDMVAVQRLIKG